MPQPGAKEQERDKKSAALNLLPLLIAQARDPAWGGQHGPQGTAGHHSLPQPPCPHSSRSAATCAEPPQRLRATCWHLLPIWSCFPTAPPLHSTPAPTKPQLPKPPDLHCPQQPQGCGHPSPGPTAPSRPWMGRTSVPKPAWPLCSLEPSQHSKAELCPQHLSPVWHRALPVPGLSPPVLGN